MTNVSDEFKAQAKQELLGLAENISKESVKSIFKIAELAIKDSETKVDDAMLLPALPKLQELILNFVDRIKE